MISGAEAERRLSEEQNNLFRMDQIDIQSNFLQVEPNKRTPIIWKPLSIQGGKLAEEKIQPTGVILSRQPVDKGEVLEYEDVIEKCGLPYTVRYQRKDKTGKVVREEYWKYTPESYTDEYESNE